jgi:hypothetical protein
MSDLKFNERELKTILYSLEDTIRTWGVDADGQVDEEIELVKKIKKSLKEKINVDISFTQCSESGDKIIDTEQMLEDFNDQLNTLINKY